MRDDHDRFPYLPNRGLDQRLTENHSSLPHLRGQSRGTDKDTETHFLRTGYSYFSGGLNPMNDSDPDRTVKTVNRVRKNRLFGPVSGMSLPFTEGIGVPKVDYQKKHLNPNGLR